MCPRSGANCRDCWYPRPCVLLELLAVAQPLSQAPLEDTRHRLYVHKYVDKTTAVPLLLSVLLPLNVIVPRIPTPQAPPHTDYYIRRTGTALTFHNQPSGQPACSTASHRKRCGKLRLRCNSHRASDPSRSGGNLRAGGADADAPTISLCCDFERFFALRLSLDLEATILRGAARSCSKHEPRKTRQN